MSVATANHSTTKETVPSTKKAAKPYPYQLREGTKRKYKAIQERMKVLYDKERKRYDDCVKQLMYEFYIENSGTIYRILATEIT